MSVIEELRQNNPTRTCIWIRLRDETSDADLAQALQQNPFVTEIGLDLEEEQRADWDSLLRVIATRANLETVKLQDAFHAEERNAPAGVGSLNLASDSAEHCHSKCGVALATSSHRYFYVCGHCIFNHIIQSVLTVTWILPSGNKEQEVSRRHFSATQTLKL